MAEEYVKRSTLLYEYDRQHTGEPGRARKLIEEATAADVVEVKHGRWISAYEYALKLGVSDKETLEEVKEDKWWKFCEYCEQQVKGFFNYCPNCGARMDGE